MSQSAYGLILPGRHKIEPTHQGGAAYASDVWERLRRVLILGTDHNTFYVGKNDLTKQGIDTIQEAIDENPYKVATMVSDIARSRLAPKQDPAIVALSMLASQRGDTTQGKTCRAEAYRILPDVIQIPTNLYMFLTFTLKQRGWSAGLKRAVSRWIEGTPSDKLGYWAIKYQQRDGMSFHDVLKMVHPEAPTPAHAWLYNWISGRGTDIAMPGQVIAADAVLHADEHGLDAEPIAALIRANRLPREVVPTRFLNDPGVWEALLVDMPVHAMIRNLGKMTNVGLITRKSAASRTVRDRLLDPARLHGLHPLALVIAQKQYEAGHGDKGSLSWKPDVDLVDALDEAFYLSLGQLQAPAGNHIYAVDESGSMGHASAVSVLKCREAAAVMALAVAHAHKGNCDIYAFDTTIRPLPISQRQRLPDVLRMLQHGGGTNCSLLLDVAAKNYQGTPIHGATVFTDGQDGVMPQYYGGRTPFHETFRKTRISHPTLRAAVVAMEPYSNQLPMPNDPNVLSVVGLDTAVPDLLRSFYDGALA